LGRFFGSGSVGSGAGVTFPAGSMMLYGGTTAPPPAGWLLCDGQAVSRAAFAALFSIIGTLYGVGDGSTTFNLPDFRSSQSFPRGATNDAGRGTIGGVSDTTLTEAQSGLVGHTHNYTGIGSVSNGIVGANLANITGAVNGRTTAAVAGAPAAASHDNKPPFQDVNFIIHV